MSSSSKPSLILSPRALLRYRFTSMIEAHVLAGMNVDAAVRLVATLRVDDRTVSPRTLYRWLKAAKEGPQALEPRPRPQLAGSRVLEDELLDWLVGQKDVDPKASIPELILRAREADQLHPTAPICRSTVLRALKRRGVDTRRQATVGKDTRRWGFDERLQLVMADFKEFRAGPTRRKRLALYMLDDATRRGLDVKVTSGGEAAGTVLRGLHQTLRRVGRFDVLYVDRGPGFIANVISQVMARLNPPIPVILGTGHYPEARGKIERFNQSLKRRLLRHLAKEGVDPDLGALTLRLEHDLARYNQLPHSSLEGQCPDARWHQSTRPLRPVGDEAALVEAFTLPIERTVSNDHVVSVDGVFYEVPRGYARTKLTLHRRMLEVQEDEDALYMDHQDQRIRLFPVDLAANAVARRAPHASAAPEPEGSPPVLSAAERAFARTLAPMCGPDGGYPDHDAIDDEEV